jgi:hypothetical protein
MDNWYESFPQTFRFMENRPPDGERQIISINCSPFPMDDSGDKIFRINIAHRQPALFMTRQQLIALAEFLIQQIEDSESPPTEFDRIIGKIIKSKTMKGVNDDR